jgi:hypothetical protein
MKIIVLEMILDAVGMKLVGAIWDMKSIADY